jgi:hypothetical protein
MENEKERKTRIIMKMKGPFFLDALRLKRVKSVRFLQLLPILLFIVILSLDILCVVELRKRR